MIPNRIKIWKFIWMATSSHRTIVSRYLQSIKNHTNWQDNYKSMGVEQIIVELRRIYQSVHFIDDRNQRINYLTSELAIKSRDVS